MNSKNNKSEDMKSVFVWMGIGIEFVIIVMFFTFLGGYLDQFQDTFPAFMIMGFLLGFAIEFRVILKRAGDMKHDKNEPKNSSSESEELNK